MVGGGEIGLAIRSPRDAGCRVVQPLRRRSVRQSDRETDKERDQSSAHEVTSGL
jgi:hypothetical protein